MQLVQTSTFPISFLHQHSYIVQRLWLQQQQLAVKDDILYDIHCIGTTTQFMNWVSSLNSIGLDGNKTLKTGLEPVMKLSVQTCSNVNHTTWETISKNGNGQSRTTPKNRQRKRIYPHNW